MVVEGDQDLSYEEKKITKILISIINLYGNDGLPLDRVNEEFQNYCGFVIPYKKFGTENLRSWILTLPNIYLVLDSQNNEVLIQQSPKSTYIKQFILKQKSNTKYQMKRKNYDVGYCHRNIKKPKKFNSNALPQGSFIHTSINNTSINESTRFDKFEQLVSCTYFFYTLVHFFSYRNVCFLYCTNIKLWEMIFLWILLTLNLVTTFPKKVKYATNKIIFQTTFKLLFKDSFFIRLILIFRTKRMWVMCCRTVHFRPYTEGPKCNIFGPQSRSYDRVPGFVTGKYNKTNLRCIIKNFL